MNIDVKKNIGLVGSEKRKTVLDLYLPQTGENIPLLVFLHGFKGFKDWGTFPDIFKAFAENGIAVLSFNFSHNGGTVDDPIDFPDLDAFAKNTYSKELKDVKKVIEWIEEEGSEYLKNVNKKQATIIGHSRGGGIALLSAAKHSFFERVITLSAVADFSKRLPPEDELQVWENHGVYFIRNSRTGQNMPMNYTFIEDMMEHTKELSIERAVKSLEIPQLIIHGEQDETVSLQDALKIKQWNPKSEIHIISNATHTFNGEHPWKKEKLPEETREVINICVAFIKS